MAKSTLTSFSTGDVASHGDSIGIPYNAALELMQTDDIIPMYDAPYCDIYQSDCNRPEAAYGWSPETCRLLLSFMEKEGVTEFRMQA